MGADNQHQHDWQTEARRQYEQKPIPPAVKKGDPNASKAPERTTFEAVSTNSSDYRQWDNAKPSTPFRPNSDNSPLGGNNSSEGMRTESQCQYDTKPIIKAKSCAPTHNNNNPNNCLSNNSQCGDIMVSNSHSDYIHHQDAKPAQNLRPKEVQSGSVKEDRDFVTEGKSQYNPNNNTGSQTSVSPTEQRASKRGTSNTMKNAGKNMFR